MNIISLIQTQYPLILIGLRTTFLLWLCSGMVSLLLGSLLGTFNSGLFPIKFLQPLIKVYVFVMRAIPLFVQLLIVYFVLPDLISINFSPLMASIIALGFCSAAYVAEIIRSGIEAVAKTQWEAAQVLGFSQWQTFRTIIAPQAVRIVIPSLINEFESLLKSTALFSTIGVIELTKTGQNIIARFMNPGSTYMIIAFLYLGISFIFYIAINFIKKLYIKNYI